MTSRLQEITEALIGLREQRPFALQWTAPADALRLSVEGVGEVRLPFTPWTARALCRAARPACHGYKEETRLDLRVRDTWEIPAERLVIDEPRWAGTLAPALQRIRAGLGLPRGVSLRAQLHKLLVYQPGQHFLPHQDSEKGDGMIATLVVVLPSRFAGGRLCIEHQGDRLQVRGSPSELTLAAFYADCRHEVHPVKAGHRAVLTYNLYLQGEAAAELPGEPLDRLTRTVGSFLGEAPPGEPLPVQLVHLLDHEYTQAGLAWGALKGADVASAAALREAARRLDCVAYLTLAEVGEDWGCVSDPDEENALDSGCRYAGRERGHADVEEEPDGDEHLDLDEDDDLHWEDFSEGGERPLASRWSLSVTLSHFIGPDPPPDTLSVWAGEDELCGALDAGELEPFRSEYQPYTGNDGNRMERWYRRAAIVLVPRERLLRLHHRASPLCAMQLSARLLEQPGGRAATLPRVQDLLHVWNAPYLKDPGSVLAVAVGVALRLGEPDTAAALLAGFRLTDMSARAAVDLAALGRAYGQEWLAALLRAWSSHDKDAQRHCRHLGGGLLPVLCEALAGQDCRSAARQLLAAGWERLCHELLTVQNARPDSVYFQEAVQGLGPVFVDLLKSAVICAESVLQGEILALLTQDEPWRRPLVYALLRDARERHSGAALRALGLAPVHARAVNALTHRPGRSEKVAARELRKRQLLWLQSVDGDF
jgi:hypothetical protein